MAEQKCHKITKQMAAYVLFERSAYISAFFYAIYCNCVGNFDTSTYYLPLRLAPPFNIDSLLGWYPFWALQFMIGVAYLCGTVGVTMYFACCCVYLEALCDHFNHLMESIDAEFQTNPKEPSEPASVNYQKSLNACGILIDAIEHHNKIYE